MAKRSFRHIIAAVRRDEPTSRTELDSFLGAIVDHAAPDVRGSAQMYIVTEGAPRVVRAKMPRIICIDEIKNHTVPQSPRTCDAVAMGVGSLQFCVDWLAYMTQSIPVGTKLLTEVTQMHPDVVIWFETDKWDTYHRSNIRVMLAARAEGSVPR